MDGAVLEELRNTVRGAVSIPGDAAYDAAVGPAAKTVGAGAWNHDLVSNKKPLAVFQPMGTHDVAKGVKFAAAHNLSVSVASGGHSVHSFAKDSFAIDLCNMRAVRVDPEAQTAWVQGGAKMDDLDRECQHFGLGVTGGHYPGTGVGGLFCAGGFGHLVRYLGMLIDVLLEAEVVLADGSVVTATPDKNSDLFWAIGGGSGNFGIATWIKLKLREVPMLLGGPIVYPLSAAPEVYKNMREVITDAKDELNVLFGQMGSAPGGGPPVTLVLAHHVGGIEDGSAEKALEPLRKFGQPIADHVHPMPYLALQNMFNANATPASYYDTSVLLEELSDDAIAVLEELAQRIPNPQSSIVGMAIGGAAARRSPTDTPFFYRNAKYWVLMLTQFETGNEEERTKCMTWAKELKAKLRPYAVGLYAGEVRGDAAEPDSATTKILSFFGDNIHRLRSIKRKYDPNNIFRHNCNILPAEEA